MTTRRRRPTALEFLRRLWSLDNALDSASKRMIRDFGISGPQRVVLRLVAQAGELGPGEIAGQMRHHPATVSSLLKRLEEAGHVERRESDTDRRRIVVAITETGRSLAERTHGTIESRVEAVLRDESPDDVAACMRVMTALAEALAPDDAS